MSGTVSLALLGSSARPGLAQFVCCVPDELRERIRDMIACANRYRELDRGDIVDARSLRAWQTSYDCLVAAGDAVRNAITDATPGKDAAIELARSIVPPSCDRAYLYWQPINGMSEEYAIPTQAFLNARADLACSYGCPWPGVDDTVEQIGKLIDATRVIRDLIPRNAADRRAARLVIESLNNDDMVYVAIVRSKPMELARGDFACWARPCGSFTCERCNEWLGREEEGIWL